MNARLISRLASMLKVAAEAAGLTRDDIEVMAGPESVGLVGTGVDVVWSPDAQGRGRPGWQVRETYHVVDLATGCERMATDPIAAFAPDELFQAARAAVLTVVQRRVEAALSRVA